jgi:hypothetical protein
MHPGGTAATGADLLHHLEAARHELAWVIEQFPEPFALWSPAEGAWSAHQALAHLRDTEREAFVVRVQRVLTEDNPDLEDFPGGEWIARWRPSGPMRDTLAEYLAASRASSTRLATVPAAAWTQTGTHPTFGRLSLLGWVERMHFHLLDHLSQILAVRAELRAQGLLS